jgi:hypothetical protein
VRRLGLWAGRGHRLGAGHGRGRALGQVQIMDHTLGDIYRPTIRPYLVVQRPKEIERD